MTHWDLESKKKKRKIFLSNNQVYFGSSPKYFEAKPN